jgi:glutamate-1-semialdehyde 2,1-aminomutase
VPSVEQLRFTNSGSEATMVAVEIARVATGRRKVLMARYGYHGSAPHFECGTFGHEGPDTLLATYGEPGAFEAVLREHGAEIAAVILEPVMGSAGLVAAKADELERIGRAARAAGAVFILDEVITLRLSTGGAQAELGVLPDLTAMGKIIGGGFPVGAVGGRADLLALCDPDKPRLFHSGTFNGNPVTTAAGLVSLQHLTAEQIDAMAVRATELEMVLSKAAAGLGVPLSVRRSGSMLQLFLSEVAPDAIPERTDGAAMTAFHLAALNHGVFFAPRGLLAMSTVLDDELVGEAGDRLTAAMADVAAETFD